MEGYTNQEFKTLNDRVTDMSKRIEKVDGRVERVESKVETVESKFNDKHVDMVKLTTELEANSKASRESTNRLTKSIESLVDEIKESNKVNGDRFIKVESKIGEVENLVKDKTLEINVGLEEKKMSKGLLGTIITAILVLVGTLAKIIAPLIVG